MARPDSRVMVLIGAGWQAQAQLEAISLVLPALERVQVWSRSAQRVQDFIGEMNIWRVIGPMSVKLMQLSVVIHQ